MSRNNKSYGLLQAHYRSSSVQSRLLLSTYFLLGILGLLLYFKSTNILYHGMGIATLVFCITALISEMPDWIPFLFKKPLPHFPGAIADKSYAALKIAERLMEKSKTQIFLMGIIFFMSFALLLITMVWKNLFLTGVAIALTLLAAIKWSLDYFIQWQRFEFIRLLKKELPD